MRYISDLLNEIGANSGAASGFGASGCPIELGKKQRVNVLALGDVGVTMLIGLRLLGSDVISEIGVCDIRTENTERAEHEINQINYPFGYAELPPVKIVSEDELFDCDVFVFAASRGIPEGASDVRMAQLDANREIVSYYADLALSRRYSGLIAVVSDPVDNLCAAFLDAGINANQISGYGLGVMNARALYYAARDERFASYEREGRAFGPHGQDLVIANSIENYDDELSRELTGLVVGANTEIREFGFKPYIAPAISSAAISIILTLRGEWHYSSIFFGEQGGDAEPVGECDGQLANDGGERLKGAYLGIKNRLGDKGWEYEDIELPDELYERIRTSYLNLCGTR